MIRRYRLEFADGRIEAGLRADSDVELDAFLAGVPVPRAVRRGPRGYGEEIMAAISALGPELDRCPNGKAKVNAVAREMARQGLAPDELPAPRTIRDWLDKVA